MFTKAMRSEADALILDLEDAVPSEAKDVARADVARFIREQGSQRGAPVLLVRVNGLDGPEFMDDVTAVVAAGAAGIVVPKVTTETDVVVASRMLHWLEARAHREVGATIILPILETASALRRAYEIGRASTRVAYMGGLATPGGDVERAIGYRSTREGWETLTLRAQALLDVRAAGVPNPITGLWTEVRDLDGLRAFALQGRGLGYEGMVVIHPSHVAIVNEVFGQSKTDLDHYDRLIQAMSEATTRGSAAIMFDGHMVDIAMLKTAQAELHRSRHGVEPSESRPS
ncbi:MAG: citrate lyase subunit beta / citryl-CoA lyase [Solirubrobacteraceae bacterium]|jgi:citrate lyase subunit beta/citryl-CoA lyase|nr:citrate lyase subunit beta / citryl-CoA lyase [Solirubrobacteraceae bacterium]MEA2276567.1 citrate lyase subunit beta / citryl-CoA lyase [Solirubrobacteraceae bacterium]MEA2393784.1 citrate lyase subunit beta / citryl-CoA lyase [Solirubrobacteraceae bacterium]